MLDIPDPTQPISPKAITVWRIRDAVSKGITLIILCALLFATYYFHWYDWIALILYFLIAYVVLKGIYELTIKPKYLQRTWRYDIDADFIQLKNGLLHRHHVIIPMSRVEYVNTDQGPLLRRFGLASITIGTIASSHEIPALPVAEAERLRGKIAHLAKIEQKEREEMDGGQDE